MMRMYLFLLAAFCTFFFSCRRYSHCENALVLKSKKCGVEWEVSFEGKSYPVDSLPKALKRDKNNIFLDSYHFYNDPRLCPCCGYRWLVVERAEDEVICL